MSTSIWERTGSIPQKFWQDGRVDFPIYDMHGHMGAHSAIYMNRCTPEKMAAHLRRCGISRLVFSHHESLWGCRRCVEDYKICQAFPDLYRMYVSINPHFQDNIREDLAQFDRWSPYAVGLKILADYHKVHVTDKRYEYALDFAEERGIPVLFHTWGGSEFDGGEIMLELVHKYHNLKFFLGHSIHDQWDKAVACVKESAGNVYLELTAIPGDRDIIEMLCRDAGSQWLLFGTDMPWFDEFQAIGGVVSADITEDDMRNILYRNAENLLGKDF